jgi:hypothetical protein
VETKRVNEALRNNLDKFPEDYCFTLQVSEKQLLVENFDRFSVLKHSTVEPKAFTEKGLYMLATILKSARATEATISIIETFAKLRELSRTLNNLPDASEEQQKSLLEKSGDLFTDLLDNNLQATDSETASPADSPGRRACRFRRESPAKHKASIFRPETKTNLCRQ